jgi:peroxiredoxin
VVSLFNDLIWWLPFAGALWYAFKMNSAPKVSTTAADNMESVLSQHGHSLVELSLTRPVLVTFLRHSGCTFCREALADLAQSRAEIEQRGLQLALVHMSSDAEAARLFEQYGLEDVERFSDPEQRLYRAFELSRGRFLQLLGPAIWWRGFLTAIVARHGFGSIQGDGFQMPGVFVLDRGRIVASYRHRTAADRPDYCSIAKT